MKILLMALALHGSAETCSTPAQRAATDHLYYSARDCVRSEARRLARSRERADIVADAALNRCDGRLQTFRAAFQNCSSWADARALDGLIRRRLRGDAIGIVVDARAR